MDTRRIWHITWRALLAMSIASGAFGCKVGGSDASPTATTAPAGGDVVRYANMETPASGVMSIRDVVVARKAADRFSAQVLTLQTGAAVTRVAQYGQFTLVTWNNGTGMGWVETAIAMRVTLFDGGLQPGQAAPAGFNDAGALVPQPVVVQPLPTVAATTPTTPKPATTPNVGIKPKVK